MWNCLNDLLLLMQCDVLARFTINISSLQDSDHFCLTHSINIRSRWDQEYMRNVLSMLYDVY